LWLKRFDDALLSRSVRSEENEDLLDVAFNALDFLAENVEADGLGEGTALANSDDITSPDAESGGAVNGNVVMALLESSVLGDEVEVIASDHDGPGHFTSRGDNTPNQRKKSAMSISI
jgi:hypothetical protein